MENKSNCKSCSNSATTVVVMVIIAIFFAFLIFMGSCAPTTKRLEYGSRVVVIDGCEYVDWGYGLAHKGNCQYCTYRRKVEQDSLVAKINRNK
jgi:hypothetical protein